MTYNIGKAWMDWKSGGDIRGIARRLKEKEADVQPAIWDHQREYLRGLHCLLEEFASLTLPTREEDIMRYSKLSGWREMVQPHVEKVEELFGVAPTVSEDECLTGMSWNWLIDGKCFDVCIDAIPGEDNELYVFVWSYEDSDPIRIYEQLKPEELVELAQMWLDGGKKPFAWTELQVIEQEEREANEGRKHNHRENQTQAARSEDGVYHEVPDGGEGTDTEGLPEPDVGQPGSDSTPKETNQSSEVVSWKES